MPLKAAIFDMDGVVTDTASTHFAAWKEMFDVFLKNNAAQHSIKFNPFTHQDYLQFVDGKPREDGIQSFLKSRQIQLALGFDADNFSKNTIKGLGNYKNQLFLNRLQKGDITVFDSTLNLIKQLLAQNIKIGIVTSSKNCQHVLKSANITHYFDKYVDGITRKQLNLKGKPAADMFLKLANDLEVIPDEAFVVEDAISGVAAAHQGHFRLVIAIDRKGAMQDALIQAGADKVVTDLQEISLEVIQKYFNSNQYCYEKHN